MLRSVLMDKLSEFLMVEQGGLQLYTVVEARCTHPLLKGKYAEFRQETARHREVLLRLVQQLGGDPNYVSPTARLAQYKACKLLESSLVVDGLSQQEIEANDLENVLLAETKDHADWSLLKQMAQQASQSGLAMAGQVAGAMVAAATTTLAGGPTEQVDMARLAQAVAEAVAEVEPQEDEHLTWAREMLATLALQMGTLGPAPSPERWQALVSSPESPIEQVHPTPIREGLLESSQQPQWLPSVVSRAMAAGQ